MLWSSRVPLMGRGIPKTSGSENHWGLRPRETKPAGVLGDPLKGLAHRFTWTHALHHCGSSLNGTRDIHRRKTELSGIRARVERQVFPIQKCWQRTLFLIWVLPSWSQQVRAIFETTSTWLTLCTLPCWFPTSPPSQLFDQPKLFPLAFPYEWAILGHTLDFPKIFLYLDSAWPVPLIKWPSLNTTSSWLWSAAWLLLEISKPNTSSSYHHIAL